MAGAAAGNKSSAECTSHASVSYTYIYDIDIRYIVYIYILMYIVYILYDTYRLYTVYTGPCKGNPGPLLIPAPYARKLRGGNKSFISGSIR